MLPSMSCELRVCEIFNSIEGEGRRAGKLAAFVRLAGCNLRCSYCDTAYAFEGGRFMTPEAIFSAVSEMDSVTITGGEPLTQDIHELLFLLRDHHVNIETNGSIRIDGYRAYRGVFFTVDYKLPSSGVQAAMLEDNFRILRPFDVLKFVVADRRDLDEARRVFFEVRPRCLVYVSPVFGRIEPADIVAYLKAYDLQEWRLQLQLHKIIWSPEKRGV